MKRYIPLVGLAAALVTAPLASALTIVVDMKSAAQGTTSDENGYSVGAFNYAGFGFTTPAQQTALDNAVLSTLNNAYHGIPTKATLAASPIPAGFELNVNFVLGDIGTAPSNGDSEYYYAEIGSGVTTPGAGVLGIAGLSRIRTAAGSQGGAANHAVTCSIFSDVINGIGGLTPSNALTSGNLTYSMYGVAGTLAHEIGHNFSLSHINKAGSVQPNGLPPIMGTGAIDLPNQDRIGQREFSLSGFDGENNNAPRAQIAQLVSAIGLRAVPEPTALASLALFGLGLARRRRTA